MNSPTPKWDPIGDNHSHMSISTKPGSKLGPLAPQPCPPFGVKHRTSPRRAEVGGVHLRGPRHLLPSGCCKRSGFRAQGLHLLKALFATSGCRACFIEGPLVCFNLTLVTSRVIFCFASFGPGKVSRGQMGAFVAGSPLGLEKDQFLINHRGSPGCPPTGGGDEDWIAEQWDCTGSKLLVQVRAKTVNLMRIPNRSSAT